LKISYIVTIKKEIKMGSLIKKMSSWFSLDSESGVTAIEYGLIASLIAVAIIVAVTLVGTNLSGLFTYIAGKVVAP
jgi:pilus assembly protein Flp/PilA